MVDRTHRLVTGAFPALDRWLVEDIRARLGSEGTAARPALLTGAGLAGRRIASLLERDGINPRRVRRLTPAAFPDELLDRVNPVALPDGGADALLRSVAARLSGDNYFAAVLDRPGLRAALLRVLDELSLGDFEPEQIEPALRQAAEATGDTAGKLAGLGELFREYRRALTGPYIDRFERIRAAIDAVRGGEAAIPGHLYVHGLLDLEAMERRLIAAVAARTGVSLLVPHDGGDACRRLDRLRRFGLELRCEEIVLGDGAAANALGRVRTRWFGAGSAPDVAAPAEAADTPADRSFAVVAAPGPLREVREAAREVIGALREGVPPAEIAVVCRDGRGYLPLVHEVFSTAGIAHYLPGGLSVAGTPSGRAALLLASLARSGRGRAEVMELFLAAPLRWEALLGDGADGTEPAPQPAAWDRLSREAGVIGGAEQWRTRLRALAADLALRADDSAEDDAAAGVAGDRAQLTLLQRAVESLFTRVDLLTAAATWIEGVERFGTLLADLLRPDSVLDSVQEGIRKLRDLAGLEADGDPAALLAAVSAAIVETVLDVGRFGEDVFAGDLTAIRGLSFRRVWLLGAGEHRFPAPPPRDPILDEPEREALNQVGPGRIGVPADQAGAEDLLFQFVLHAARERLVLSYPHTDGEGRDRLPSFYILRAAEAIGGAPVDPTRLAALPFYRRASAARLAPPDPTDALTAAEYDIAEVERALAEARGTAPAAPPPVSVRLGYLDRLSPDFVRSRAAVASRLGERRLTAFDGIVEDGALREALVTRYWRSGRPLSPTALETYAACPRRFFLGRALGLRRPEEPEAIRRLRADHRGRLIHAILERFLSTLAAEGALPLRRDALDAERERLHAVAGEEFDALHSRGLTGAALLWELDQIAILEDLDEWLIVEVAAAEREGLIPYRFEVTFGRKGPEAPAALPPVEYELAGGQRIRLIGTIDRVDRSADGRRFRVLDYKSGRVQGRVAPNLLKGGTALQLPIYLLAAQALDGIDPAAVGDAEYFYVTRREGYKRVAFERAALEERRADLDTVLRTIVEGVSEGRFFPHPGKAAANCTYCDFNTVCDSRIAAIFERKRDDPAAANFIALEAIQ